jgi:hypothetical protein
VDSADAWIARGSKCAEFTTSNAQCHQAEESH